MEIFLLYLWTRLDVLLAVAHGAIIISGIAAVLFTFAVFAESEQPQCMQLEPLKALRRLAAAVFVAALTAVLALPTQRDTALIVGASLALDAARSPEGEKAGALLRMRINELLDAELAKSRK